MLTTYSMKGQEKPEEIAEVYSQAWCVEKLEEIKRWAHQEKVPLKAWKREISFINEIIHAIKIGHPAPRMLAGYATLSLNENFPRPDVEGIDVLPVAPDPEPAKKAKPAKKVSSNASEKD